MDLAGDGYLRPAGAWVSCSGLVAGAEEEAETLQGIRLYASSLPAQLKALRLPAAILLVMAFIPKFAALQPRQRCWFGKLGSPK